DGSADVIEISPTNTGRYAGVNLSQLSFTTRNEVETLTFSNISAATTGSFFINGQFGLPQEVKWSPDPNILLNGGTDSLGNTTIGIKKAFENAAGSASNVLVKAVTNTTYTIEFIGTLAAQDL